MIEDEKSPNIHLQIIYGINDTDENLRSKRSQSHA